MHAQTTPSLLWHGLLTVPQQGGSQCAKPQAAERWVLRPLAWLLLAGWLLFAHGCHGDEDNELFARLSAAPASAAAPDTASAPRASVRWLPGPSAAASPVR